MNRVTIRKIPDKSVLKFLGNCFKRKGVIDSDWQIAAYYLVGEEVTPCNLHFGLMPKLGLGRYYDRSSIPSFTDRGYRSSFTLPPIETWPEAKIRDCPLFLRNVPPADAGQQLCYFMHADGVQLWIPKLELARVLFFPSAFLAHLAFQPNGLADSFRVNRPSADLAVIEVLLGTDFPKYYLGHSAYRAHLAWLLLNDEAQDSFNTIYGHRLRHQQESSKYLRWAFDFKPPNLAGCSIEVRGHYAKKLNVFYVYQITGVRGLNSGVEGEVHFVTPEGYEPGGKAGGKSVAPVPEDDDLEIQDDDAKEGSGARLIAHTPNVGLQFQKPVKTKRIDKSKHAGGIAGGSDEEGEASVNLTGSVAEGTASGHVPGADFDQLEETVDLANMEGKFAQFNRLVDLLEDEGGIAVLSRNILPMPELVRCHLYLNADGSRRRYMHVVVKTAGGNIRHLLEVDTSDAKKSLATKILTFSAQDSDEFVNQVMQRVVKRSLCWPTKFLNRECQVNQSVKHPRSKAPGYLEPDELQGWFARMAGYIS
ncbi:Tn7-like element transposition protein TnsE [Aestuariispira ectoiniformans]|uniref:Tn7-like element transposition protein TnsE n=1 Tax=Aestuariispira ectoiniformans TaxID=2775080 RepID=UPI00223B3550|nr:Tn7-like element transposition protein TnsE [Aestuariispira ectoiniformans]